MHVFFCEIKRKKTWKSRESPWFRAEPVIWAAMLPELIWGAE
jgi:hypothetical protein